MISREKARREEAWDRLEKAYAKDERVEGAIVGRVKGGFTVDLGGAAAFLPGSQVDIRPVRDVGPLMGMHAALPDPEDGPPRGNIVVSRRAILEEAAPNSAPSWSRSCTRAKSSTAWSRTSPTTARSSTSAASTACCTSPT